MALVNIKWRGQLIRYRGQVFSTLACSNHFFLAALTRGAKFFLKNPSVGPIRFEICAFTYHFFSRRLHGGANFFKQKSPALVFVTCCVARSPAAIEDEEKNFTELRATHRSNLRANHRATDAVIFLRRHGALGASRKAFSKCHHLVRVVCLGLAANEPTDH